MEKYSRLFSPAKIGNVEIKNRVIMTAMGTGMGTTDRCFSEQMIEFYTERARGGVGLIIPETSMVNEVHGFGAPCQISYASDRIIPSLQKLCDSVHKYDAKLFVQLYHPGREMSVSYSWGVQPVSSSTVISAVSGVTPRALSTEEVHSVIQDFVDASVRAQSGGADGVEIHAGHGYLLNQFISPYTNKRSDEFGGDTYARTKILRDIISGIRLRCGSFPIMVRISVEEFMGEQGLQLAEGVEMCKILEAAGVDALDVTCGIYDTQNYSIEPFSFKEGWRVYLAEAVKKVVSIPVSGNGKIRHPAYAETLLTSGTQDFIGMARTHLADPQWCNKVASGREDQIRYCISCMRCSESRGECGVSGQPIDCSVNPLMGRELRYPELKKNGVGKLAVVIGGGPSGMEAARVLGERRYKVVLFEEENELGGQLRFAKVSNPKIEWLISYYKRQFELLGVEVKLNTRVTAEMVAELHPHGVILAAGGAPLVPGSMPGVHGKNVHTATDVLGGSVKLDGKTVAVIGSGITGLEVAEYMAERSCKVNIVEMAAKLTPDGYRQIVKDITDRLVNLGVKFYPGHKLLGITDTSVKLEGEHSELFADEVVLALGVRKRNELCAQLKQAIPNTICTGDASRPGKIFMATSSAFFAANKL